MVPPGPHEMLKSSVNGSTGSEQISVQFAPPSVLR